MAKKLISRRKVWLLPALVLLFLAIALMMYGVLSTSWVHVDCDNRGIEIGMWRMCLNAIGETGDTVTSHHTHQQVERNWTDTAELCQTILLGRGNNIPQWLASIQMLTLFGVGAVVFTTVLTTLYLFVKSRERIAIGLAAVCLCSGTFVFIALFTTASHMYIHEGHDSKTVAINKLIATIFEINCEQFSDSSSISMTLLWVATACIFLAGALAIAASCCLESGLGEIKQLGGIGYSTVREDLLYSLVQEDEAYFDTSEEETEDNDDGCQSSNNVSRKQSFKIVHETGASKSTA